MQSMENFLSVKKLPTEKESGEGFDNEKKEKGIRFFIDSFEKEKSADKKFDILRNFLDIEPEGEILDFIERFSEDLIAQNKKIWDEDREFANEFESVADDDDTVLRPLVSCFVEILKKTKGTEYQPRGEEISIMLLKNWDDFEVDYFYDFIGELNGWQDKKQAEKALAENEFIAMHKESGFDEKIEGWPEDIKSWSTANINFIKIKNNAIDSLGEIGTKKSVDFLIEEFVKGKRSACNNELAKAFDKIDPEYAKDRLIELVDSNDEIVKVNSIMILYRLQFGDPPEIRALLKNTVNGLACRKFHEIIEQTKLNRDELKALFKNEKNISDEEIEKITHNLINKAGRVLVEYSSEIGKGGKADKDKLFKELDAIEKNSVLFASVYKAMDKKEIKFEDLEGVEFEKKTANDLSNEEIGQMMKIYAKNYEYNQKFQEAILKNFENILKERKDKTILYMFKENGEVVAFNRFDGTGKGRKYFGSFNVKPIMSGADIGKALMKVSLDKEAQDNIIEADCIPYTLISSRYIGGKCGFIVKKLDKDYKKTGVPLFNIERREENKKYHYFNYSDKQIVDEYESKNTNNEYDPGVPRFILKFDPKSAELIKTSDDLINKEGYAISNYVFSKDGKEVYCAFEKDK